MSYSDRHYGAGNPDCPDCQGIGYISYNVPEDHPYFGKVFDCHCRREDVAAEQMTRLRRLSGLDHLDNKTFATFNPNGMGLDPHYQGVLQRVFESVHKYAEEPEGWLFLSGGYGCGKTHLAAAAANYRIENGKTALFIGTPDLLDYLRAAYSPGLSEEGETYQSRFEDVRTTPFLILDDLGTENSTPWAVEKLYQILNYRYLAKLPTIITSNHRLDEMEPRLRSRLADPDVIQILTITAPDYRQSGISTTQLNIGGLGPYKHMSFDTFDLRLDLPKGERESLKRIVEIARQYAEKPQGWLTILGTYGAGKTHLAASIVNENVARGIPTLFVTVPDLLQHLRVAFGPESNISHDKLFNDLRSTTLLAIDDFGVEWSTAWAREKLDVLLNFRYASNLPTVITSPLTLEEIEKKNPRLAVRLRDKRISRIIALKVTPYLGEAEVR